MKIRYKIINELNYKDILIIMGLWYLMAAFNFLSSELSFDYTPLLTDLFHYIFIFTGRFIFLSLVLFYFISLYSASFYDLGLDISILKKYFIPASILLFTLFITILFFINIPLSFNIISNKFNPLYYSKNPEVLIRSIIPATALFLPNLIIAISELLLLITIIYETFASRLHPMFALILSSLFYSFLLMTFGPSRILMNFIVAFISIYLYIKTRGSLIISSIFLAGYCTIYITYIYGWGFINF